MMGQQNQSQTTSIDDAFANMPSSTPEQVQPPVPSPAMQVQPPPMAPPTPTMEPVKEDPMDAFANLSVGGNSNTYGSSNAAEGISGSSFSMNQPAPIPNAPLAAEKTEEKNVQYEAKQIVCYKSNGKRSKAQILKKHLDDELEPFYTIMLPYGKEKQTDNGHLEELPASFEEIEAQLLSFSEAQLQEVKKFLSGNPAFATSLKGNTSQSPAPSLSMGQSNMTPSAPAPALTSMSSSSPAPALSMGQNTMMAPTPATDSMRLPRPVPPSPMEQSNMMNSTPAPATNSMRLPSPVPPPAKEQNNMMNSAPGTSSMMNNSSSNAGSIPSPLPNAKAPVPGMGGMPAPNLSGPNPGMLQQ